MSRVFLISFLVCVVGDVSDVCVRDEWIGYGLYRGPNNNCAVDWYRIVLQLQLKVESFCVYYPELGLGCIRIQLRQIHKNPKQMGK